MALYKLAIIGRPNVGKSSLFNRICKKNISIVHEMEGVTRDRIYAKAYFENLPFTIIDTAGIDFDTKFSIEDEMILQSQVAIEEADGIIFLVDVKTGFTNLDREIAKIILKSNKKVVVAINKVDVKDFIEKTFEFQSLGIKEFVFISASQNYQIDSLLENFFKNISLSEFTEEKNVYAKVSLIGRTNVGKSTLLNALLNNNRAVVSKEAATTRDSIDCDITIDDKTYTFIDTAGIRRKNKEVDVLEKFSHSQTIKSIQRSDVSLLVLDAFEFMTFHDKKILNTILQYAKGLIIVVNKWDQIKNVRQEHIKKAINEMFANYPVVIISALEKLNITKIFPLIDKVFENRTKAIKTNQLNKFIIDCMHKNPPPLISGKKLNFYYL